MLPFKTRRSAGVPVTPAVHRLLSRANAARDGRRWAEAAADYDEALRRDAGLAHIWVQLGNMRKELGDFAGSAAAYERAFARKLGDPEPILQLARLRWLAGELEAAADGYELAFTVARTPATAAGLRRALLLRPADARERLIDRLLAGRPAEPAASAPVRTGRRPERMVLLDVGDLLQFWCDGRLPTGIQRVQVQLLLAALADADTAFAPCAYLEGSGVFLPLDAQAIVAAAQTSLLGPEVDAPEWVACLDRLFIAAARAPPLGCEPGDVLLGVGSSWSMRGYFEAVEALKARCGARYVPLVYDLVPLMAPHFFPVAAQAEFKAWLPDVLAKADGLLTISESTLRDLLTAAAELGRPIRPDGAAVLPLNVDTRLALTPLPDARLTRWSLRPGGFALLVATLEPRKGHVTALDAWSALLGRLGADATPKLVFVGNHGWLFEEIAARIRGDAELASHLVVLGGLGDADLDLLYRTCLLTLYPSFYEGWGLPVSEALCHGKAVITTTSSSLPEAGGDLALYVPPGDAAALADAVARLTCDAVLRDGLEARIRREHRAVGWGELAHRLARSALAVAGGAP